jgi:hypothetical protein
MAPAEPRGVADRFPLTRFLVVNTVSWTIEPGHPSAGKAEPGSPKAVR